MGSLQVEVDVKCKKEHDDEEKRRRPKSKSGTTSVCGVLCQDDESEIYYEYASVAIGLEKTKAMIPAQDQPLEHSPWHCYLGLYPIVDRCRVMRKPDQD